MILTLAEQSRIRVPASVAAVVVVVVVSWWDAAGATHSKRLLFLQKRVKDFYGKVDPPW